MKKMLLLWSILLITSLSVFAQTPAPISGSTFVCLGSTTPLADATPGGTWSSSDISIAAVGPASGVVTGVSLGTAVITYTAGTGFTTWAITVKPYPALTPAAASVCVNSSISLTPSPAGGGWSSLTPSIASVNFLGVITGVSGGTATIQYTAAGGCSTTATVTVNPLPAPITGTNFVYSGSTTNLFDLSSGGTWSSGNPSLATVSSSGVVTGVSAGLLFISYTLPTGCASIYRVEVDPLPATANLYAWYPFCGDTTDHSGNGRDLINHGITTVPATLTTDRFSNANSAYHFNGVNSLINYTTFFPNSGTPPDFTYSCWVNTSVAQSAIILYNGDPTTNGFGFVINNGTMGVPGTQVGVYFGASASLYASQPITPGWHNLVLVKNGGVYHFYIDNGSGLFFLETNTPFFSDVFALGLNYHSTLPGNGPVRDAFDGDIDDIAVINRQLTSPERLSLFNFNPDARKFSLGNDTTICADKMELQPNPQTIGAIYTWSVFNGLGFVVTDTTDTLITVYPPAGPFGVTYNLSISKPYGCTARDTISIFKNPIPVDLGPDQNACIGDTITLSAHFPLSSFLWSTGDTVHTINATTTAAYYVTIDSTIYFTNSLGQPDSAVCVGRDTVNLYFHRVPVIGLPDSVRNCQGTPATLHAHFDSGYTYLWYDLSTTADSLTISSSGTYWVRVNDSGCVRYDTTVAIIVYDTISFFKVDTAICKGANVPINTRDVTFNPLSGIQYQWTPTAGIAAPNTLYTTITPDTSAEYFLTVRYPGCSDIVDSFHIDVQPNPQVSLGGNRHVCIGDTIHINGVVTPGWYGHYIYSWTPAVSLDCSTCSDVVFTGGDSTQLFLTVTTPAWFPTLAAGCIGSDSALIFVHPSHFDTVRGVADLCPGDSIQLFPNLDSTGVATNTVISRYHWSPSVYLDDSTSSAPWVHPITSQNYRLVAYSQFGCRDTDFVSVRVRPAAEINLGDSVTIYPGESYQISPQTNCVYFTWYPPLGLDNVYLSNPTATPDVNTTYIVQASTETGCTVIDSIRIRVDPTAYIALPNAFTPGAGINNRFFVIKRGIISLNYFRIFDRWGNMVFETKDINEGWDGTYKGKPQPFGVYIYEIEAQTNTRKIFKREGNVTLLR